LAIKFRGLNGIVLVMLVGRALCIGLALSGYLVPMLIGGFIGSFVGVAGLGGAISKIVPSAIVGTLIAIALQ
jgi:hypothetical protein